jgi:uncharacterized protein YgiM (DUF1202 family)
MRSKLNFLRFAVILFIFLPLGLSACTATPTETTSVPTSTEIPLDATATPLPPTMVPTQTRAVTSTPLTQAIVTAQTLNLRDGPATTFTTLARVVKDDALIVLGRNSDYTWIYVQTPAGKKGWVYASYVKMDVSIQNIAAATEPTKAP